MLPLIKKCAQNPSISCFLSIYPFWFSDFKNTKNSCTLCWQRRQMHAKTEPYLTVIREANDKHRKIEQTQKGGKWQAMSWNIQVSFRLGAIFSLDNMFVPNLIRFGLVPATTASSKDVNFADAKHLHETLLMPSTMNDIYASYDTIRITTTNYISSIHWRQF